MKNQTKPLMRSYHPPLVVPAEQWHTIAAAVTGVGTALEPVLQPLTPDERRALYGMQIANEAFTRDYVELLEAHPELAPAYLRAADTLRDWQTREKLMECAETLAQLGDKIADTIKALQSDCYAAALAGYRLFVRSGVPAGYEEALAPLRAHVALRADKRRHTRAANLALKAAEAALDATQHGGSGAPPATPTPASAIVPKSAAAPSAPRDGSASNALAA